MFMLQTQDRRPVNDFMESETEELSESSMSQKNYNLVLAKDMPETP